MKYYLVALFDKDSYSYIEHIQRNICRKYRLYKNIPPLHITLGAVENPDIEKFTKIVSDILKPYKKFKVKVNESICFNQSCKSVNLKVENKGYVIRLARQINETLKLYKFDVRDNGNNGGLHTVLANTNYSIKELTSKEYVSACNNGKKDEIYKMARIDRIALWKPINNRKEALIRNFPLRDF
ncbi:2'-5' RNA ligase family protein [Clostridium sp. AWRP]|uniref:2'-5' RNA ligase family protein n=1 Tax=Clostridium sp. AWRP TaxID=2212991 RepID=UPI000FD7AAEB|nr:2'-5' RNA ligase family protein [Clostridium sp. AWRP]AZV58872.1 2'-5' RNA ligase family protein [Clostridium sp. AWRP]